MTNFFKRMLLLLSVVFVCSFSFGQIIITEFSYDPPEAGTDSLEFIEIANIGNQPVDISGYKLLFGSTIAERFAYPANSILGSNQVSVIAVNSAALQRCYNMTTLAHQWTGTSGLGNSGSKIVLRNAMNVTVDSISFTSAAAPTGTNGNGKTAVLCDFSLDNNVMANWTPSTNAILRSDVPYVINGKALYGSPGFLECGLTTDPETDPETELNDESDNAAVLIVGETCTPTAGNLLDATESMVGCTGNGVANDLWYSFVATSNALTIDVFSGEDVVLAVYSGGVDNLEEMFCMDMLFENEQYSASNFVIGSTYFARVFAYDYNDLISGDFTICVSEFDVVENNDCATAIALTSSTTCSPVMGSLVNATFSLLDEECYSETTKDVWYSFVAQSPNTTINVEGIDYMDAVVVVYEGTCGQLSTIICQDNGSNEEVDLTNLIIGNTYFIRVADYFGGGEESTEFSICITHIAPVDPCEGVTVTGTVAGCGTDAEVTVEGGLAPYTYNWSNDETTATVNNLVVGESYTVTVADANGCEGVVIYTPVACPEVNPCEGVAVTGTVAGCGTDAEVTADGGTSPYTFDWSNGATTATVNNLVVGETYTITITDDNGCEGDVTYVPVACPVVDPCDGVTIAGVVNGCDGELDVVASGGTAPYTYLWSNGETTQEALVENNEEQHFVTITDANGCTTTVEFDWIPCASVATLEGGASLMVYPNPTANQVTIEIETSSSEDLSIEFINAMGQMVMSKMVFNNGKQSHNLSLTELSTGMYIISIKGKDILKTERLNVIK